jgi:hypothetical protein
MSVSRITCNHWHPGEPSEIKTVAREDRKNGIGEVCATCNRFRQRAKYRNKNAPNAPGHFSPPPRPPDYGARILPRLTWLAPEFIVPKL